MTKIKNEVAQPKIFTSNPIKLPKISSARVKLAELEFYGIDHFVVSYEGRVFINNSQANQKTTKSENNGYVGSFHIFGHGGLCYGGMGHCIPKPREGIYDRRSEHPLAPAYKVIDVTNYLKKIINKQTEIIVTVVPVLTGYEEMADTENVLKFKTLSLNISE